MFRQHIGTNEYLVHEQGFVVASMVVGGRWQHEWNQAIAHTLYLQCINIYSDYIFIHTHLVSSL